MANIFNFLRWLAASRPARWVGVPVVAAAALAAVLSQSAATLPPTVALASEPLYARGARAKPTLTLALSVEFPTVGAQYVGTPAATSDNSYAPTTQYVGYFDTESCYTYNNNSDASLRRFDRSGAATNRTCGGTGFSGNFMNWATSSAIDVLRLGLTGGDRVVDTSSMTVLQRAVLPNTSVSNNFWNGQNFPSKVLSSTLASGAVPDTLRGTYTGDIYVANCLNRVHFGTQATGSCATPGNNSNLGVPTGSAAIGVVSDYSGTLPSDFSGSCAAENGTCTFSGTRQVAYGANSSWKFMNAIGAVVCSNGVFGDPISGTVKACYTRNVPTSTTTTALTADNFFYSRVRVCESDGSGNLTDPRTSLCQRYSSGYYKPVGNLQKYSDRVRVAAFGYLNDSTSNPQRHGGVLRAPMKYVGAKTFDANFSLVSGANPLQEWDDSTGVIQRDPDSGGGPSSGTGSNWPGQSMSGVINYLNQFGRTGTFGQYKTYDPIGELYYESLRYLQGLQTTNIGSTIGTSAIYSINDTMRDGFPVYTTWTDPHPAVSGMTDYSCVKNNIVGIGDVNTHNDRYVPGNPDARNGKGDAQRTASDASNEPDFYQWTKVVGGFESNNAVTYIDGKGVSRTTSNWNTPNTARWGMEDQTTGADNASYYIAGMAYWANTHDIRGTGWTNNTAGQRPGMRVTTYFLDVNEYAQDSVVNTRRNRQIYLAAKYGGFNDVTKTGNPFKTLAADSSIIDDPTNANWQRQTTVADKQEAKNYFLSSSASDVLAALDEIFQTIAQEANSIAGGAISTQRLTTSGGLVYQAQFDPADWSGDLVAYPVSANASGTAVNIGTIDQSPWKNAANVSVGAAGKLDEKDPATRNIYVGYNSTAATPVLNTAEFKWASSLDDIVKNALRTPPGAASAPPYDSDAIAQSRLLYLRGDRASEAGATGGVFRKRGSRLGDIINSGVAYSGAPSQRIADSSYTTFYTTNQSRTKAIFVGANDGMLHAFNADTGDELFSYIPSWMLPKLSILTSSTYVHQSYVDASPVVAEANLGTSASADWRTVLVGGTGGGGQGVYALDVTDPSSWTGSAGTGKVLWEFTDKHDPDMGNVIGRAQILKVNVAAGGTTPNYQYFAVVASGVNNQLADGSASSTGQPTIFFLNLNKAKTDAWVLNSNYYKVKFPVASTTIASGMAGFSVRQGASDEVTYVYAGDLQGNLWKLDLTKTNASTWSSTMPSYFMNGSTPIPMYIAKDGQSTPNLQPITMEPALVFGPNRTIIVAFGTGKFLETSDNAGPFKAQSAYALLDNNSATADSTSPTAAISGRGRLIAGTVTASAVNVAAFNWGRPNADNVTTSRAGWYFDFYGSGGTTSPTVTSGTGERSISNFGVLAGRLIFGTVIPAVNSCDNGTGNLYIVDLRSGDGTAATSSVGILGEPFITQLGASTLTNSNTTGSRTETTRYQIILQGSSGLGAPPPVTTVGTVGRLSWREVNNYQEVRSLP